MGNKRTIDFANSVLNLRLRLDKGQSWVAEKLCVSETTVSNWETGATVPMDRNAYKIKKLLEENGIDPIYKESVDDENQEK